MNTSTIQANLADLHQRKIYPASIRVADGKIESISPLGTDMDPRLPYILPGFIDAHIHIESSMLVPSEFARLAVVHGTVATVSDPHEIANVCGMEGVQYMIENGGQVPFKFNFGAPSCVPATIFETAGATISVADIEELLRRSEIKYLSEMMNFPGVLYEDKEVMEKIRLAHKAGKPVDGHAPGLRGAEALKYIDAGISTDHECFTYDEAREKLEYGMKIIIREGSAAKNFEALIPLLDEFPDMIMFGSDDKHPDSLVEGHINQLCARAVERGTDIFKVLRAACYNPVVHYGLEVGLLRENDPADFILTADLIHFNVSETWIDGVRVAMDGRSLIASVPAADINNFSCAPTAPADFMAYPTSGNRDEEDIIAIGALDGQLITDKIPCTLHIREGALLPDMDNDILKIAVVNRYRKAPAAVAFIKNFGLKGGAIASSVAHDSHNIVVVGADDVSISLAVNLVIESRGGISCVSASGEKMTLGLPVGGLMTSGDGYQVAASYTAIDRMAKNLGSHLNSPFMTLSFMALLVIPHLKLSDLGLFDGDRFAFVNRVG